MRLWVTPFRRTAGRDMVARIRQLVVQKKHTEATRAAREALRRYPNSFDVVYEATQAYGYSGMEQNRPEDLRKALSLAERAMVLINQDQEREKHIRPESIWSLMGNYHAHLNEYDEAIRCYENGNVAGSERHCYCQQPDGTGLL